MDSYEVLVADTVRRADPLGRCNTCLKAPPAGTKLMKRGACLAAFYCSTQCQKAHWPRHKSTCRATTAQDPASVARYGYTSFATFSRDFQDFLDAHEWALRMIVSVQRQLQRDAHPDVPFSELPMLLRVALRCQTTSSDTQKHRSPATRFAVVSQIFHDLDAYARTQERLWEQNAPVRDEIHRAFAQQLPQYTGQLFAVHYDVPAGMDHLAFFPVQTPLEPAPGTPEQRRAILEDMLDLCTRSINDGFPLRITTLEGNRFPESLLAYPGTFVRSEGCWVWKAILEDWKSYTPGQHRCLDLAVAGVKTRLAIPDLILSSLHITCAVSTLIVQDAFIRRRIPIPSIHYVRR
ncbi:hypothetical protein OH76DRAFT_1480466 [Lentinus brumalis]|uniref:MYND-type domain-containing protein n=1 Tax=Lentinus brumalis TaxID=2498619 RepID=A0A371DK11_9APHY|nr:hypothetical protein OH76DRAFT_1480466 [Polyporus brumalis]